MTLEHFPNFPNFLVSNSTCKEIAIYLALLSGIKLSICAAANGLIGSVQFACCYASSELLNVMLTIVAPHG